MNWLPQGGNFRSDVSEALGQTDARARLEALVQVARRRLGVLETIQLDNALSKAGGAGADSLPRIKITVLSSHTVEHLAPAIRVAGLRHRMLVDVKIGGYGLYRQELLEPSPQIVSFAPDVVLLCLSAGEVLASVPTGASSAQVQELVRRQVSDLRELWRRSRDVTGAQVIQQSYLNVFPPLFGNFDARFASAPSSVVARLNLEIAEAAELDSVLILDIAGASATDGLDSWFDSQRWLQGKMEISPAAAPRFGDRMACLLAAVKGLSKRCLVLDLDNTLWGGVIGDDGIDGIVLGEGSAVGEAHLALQRYAKSLKDRGVILAVCSKNDPETALAVFQEHPNMILRRGDISAFVANWQDKAENLRSIALQLNIGLDGLVFVDDNPAERARVREALPMIEVPELPDDVTGYVRCIADAGYFESTGLSGEDLQRSKFYADNAARDALREQCTNLDEFLRSLQMVVEFGPVRPVDYVRVSQLISKTNQFNTTGRTFDVEEVAYLATDPTAAVLQFRLIDRFGDNGIVSVLVLKQGASDSGCFDIENWVMSCRVFGRQLESEVMNVAVEAASARGAHGLRAEFLPTDRNGVIKHLYEKLGFVRAVEGVQAQVPEVWQLELSRYEAKATQITRRAASS
jgi:FkbH-like protein